MLRGKRSTHCKPRGEAWREKALKRASRLKCRMLGQTLAAVSLRLRHIDGLAPASSHRPIAFSRKGLPLGF
jgi:hypothetical protein